MAQHDQNIANGAGSVVRGDINDALAALFSLSSGATAPSVTVAYQWWADTANGLLKQRNGANTAWIEHGALSEAILRTGDIAAGGSAGLLRADGDGSGLTGIDSIPVGFPFWWPASTPPSWALERDGSAISRATYAGLFTIIGTAYGSGDGSTTFNLPDDRGEFMRGWDNGRGVDPGRAFGSVQADEIKSHSHAQRSNNGGGGLTANIHQTTSARDGATDDGITGMTGGAETRPRNRAYLPCIKF